jgi:hypothetical protein
LIAALPRTFTLLCFTTAGPGVKGKEGSEGVDLEAVDAAFYFDAEDFDFAGFEAGAFVPGLV